MNFSKINSRSGFPTIPFLEASKAMARGTGYAGEGDIITAALVGALLSLYPESNIYGNVLSRLEKGNDFS
ncbi:MAG: hypothetical protein U5N58_05810 [Actinomycetota bacterium]|nr:hypothetical protein [Actinomycetota bacterium]